MANDTVWIVVPVYNAKKTLKNCVKSVQKQTYRNWKIVLVDDGSTDGSDRLCDVFAAQDSRIISVHQENAGPSAARRKGVSLVSQDDYCCFLDSDDALPRDALRILVEEIERSGAELVCGNMQRVFKGMKLSQSFTPPCFLNPKSYANEEILSELYISCFGISDLPMSLWAKIYKASKLKRVMLEDCPTPKKFAEDLDIVLRLMPLLDKLFVVPDVVYNYRTGGGTTRFMPEILSDSLFMYNRKKEYIKFYSGPMDAQRLISIEIKNIAMSYLAMCERFGKYSCGSLEKEIAHIFSLPEIKDAVRFIEGDTSGFAGSAEAFLNGDVEKVAQIIRSQQTEKGIKAVAKKILARL